MKIIAVVVTYNRCLLLQRNIACLLRNKPVSDIVVVDNGSTDGTRQWLAAQTGLHVIRQENVGGSGGFHTGIAHACSMGADWIWCMDDDVFPHADCMEQLLPHTSDPTVGILAPRRLQEGKIFTNDFQGLNLTNPFASLYVGKLAKMHITAPTDICGTAFEGLFIRRATVDRIGLPNKELFIFCDDTDYCIRTIQAGYRIRYIPSALMDKEKFFSHDSWAERNRKKKWKRFYQVRNATYLNHHYGKNPAVRYLRGLMGVMGYLAVAALTCPFTDAYRPRDIARLWKAYLDGVHERLGKM